MKFYLTDTKETKEITVRRLGANCEPDCFDDLEVNFPRTHKLDEDRSCYLCTAAEYNQLKNNWQDEIAAWNCGGVGSYEDYADCSDPDITLLAD